MNTLIPEWEKTIASRTRAGIIRDYFPGFNATSWDYFNLARLEEFLLSSYASLSEVPPQLIEDIQIYISLGLKQKYNGFWVDLSELGSDTQGMIGIGYPDIEGLDVCASMVSLPFTLQTGEYWISLFETNRKMRLVNHSEER